MRCLAFIVVPAVWVAGCSTLPTPQRMDGRRLEDLRVAAAELTVDPQDGISEAEAYRIASDYFVRRGIACGMVGIPNDEGSAWRVPVYEGIIGQNKSDVIIQKADGKMSINRSFAPKHQTSRSKHDSPIRSPSLNVGRNLRMAKYLISFPSAAMVVPDGELETVGHDARAVIRDAKAAGVYVFAGGIDEAVPPVLVSAHGEVSEGGYRWAPPLNGGFTVLELRSRDEAVAWAARIAKACRCDQELRVFGFDSDS